MQVNPSINIAIGEYGRSCNGFFHTHFGEREVELKDFTSFYNFYTDGETFRYEGVDKKQRDMDSAVADSFIGGTEKGTSEFFFRNFINKIYNKQINLLDQLTENVSFRIVNINLIFGSFEDENEIVVDHLVRHINELADEGVISNVVVKAFVILSPDGMILQEAQEIATYKNLEVVKGIQQQNRNIFTNIFFIDEKNTSAIYLGLNSESIGWMLNEVVISLMTNHYFLIGNLMQADLLSVGLGVVYFDHLFFKRFFRRKIINELIWMEHLDPDYELPNAIYDHLKNTYLLPSLNGINDKLVEELTNALKGIKDSSSIGSYKMVLSQLLEDFHELRFEDPIQNIDQVSFNDIIYQNILNSSVLISGTSAMDHKKKLDSIVNLEKDLNSYEAENDEGLFDNKIEDLRNEIQKLREQTLKEKLSMEALRKDFTFKNQPDIIKKAQAEIDVEIEKINGDLAARLADHKKQNFLARFLSRAKFKKEREIFESEVRLKEEQKREVPNKIEKSLLRLKPLIELQKELETEHSHLVKGTNELRILQRKYIQESHNAPLGKYLFVDHVIEEQLLSSYFNRNKSALTANLKDLTRGITKGKYLKSGFTNYCSAQIDSEVAKIIEFDMVDYLLGRYEELHLLKPNDLEEKLKKLDKVSLPFFNAENSFQVDNSHRLVLYSRCSDADQNRIKQALNKIFSIVPQRISSLNPHKFSFLKIDVIPDLDSLVKYNIGKKRVNLNDPTNLL